jgi:transcription antitermination factor NusG
MHAIISASQIDAQSCQQSRWYVLLTTTGLERRACIWMRLRGLQPYWARYRVSWREFQARSGIQWRSVLPGYLFLPWPADCVQTMISDTPVAHMSLLKVGDVIPGGKKKVIDYCQLVEKAPGVRRFVRNADGFPETLDEHEMDRIREIESALNDSIIAARDGIPFKVGQNVYVKRLEMIGKILRLDGRRRIIISVPMFGSSGVPLTLSVADIESI